MKKCLLVLVLLIFGVSNAEAQRRGSLQSQRMSGLSEFYRLTDPLYRKPTKKELEAIAPNQQLFQKYSSFLNQSDTELTKLVPNEECVVNTRVLVATKNCLKYSMPGAGFAYSFRLDRYRIPRLADVIFRDGGFQASGVLTHGIFVNLGDIPMEQVSLQTKGMKFLVNFQPEIEPEKAQKINDQLTEGIEKDGFLYRRGLSAEENATFALRSIAYRGSYFRAVNGITYNEFVFDKRRDIIVAFRIVERGEDGSVTILWRELENKKSPKLKRTEKEITEL